MRKHQSNLTATFIARGASAMATSSKQNPEPLKRSSSKLPRLEGPLKIPHELLSNADLFELLETPHLVSRPLDFEVFS
jgi:hypothetical protein